MHGRCFGKYFVFNGLNGFFVSGAAFESQKQLAIDASCQFSLTVPIVLSTAGDNKRRQGAAQGSLPLPFSVLDLNCWLEVRHYSRRSRSESGLGQPATHDRTEEMIAPPRHRGHREEHRMT
jgi:hypothetical protein